MMRWDKYIKYISGVSLVVGLLALILLWVSGPSQQVAYLLAFWVAMWTIGHLLAMSKTGRPAWAEHLPSIAQALSAIVLAVFTYQLVVTTGQYTAFTQDIKNYQKESFIFAELAKDKIRPITLKLTCDCQYVTHEDVRTYECKDFTVRLKNNASVKLHPVEVSAWVTNGIGEIHELASISKINLPGLWPNEKLPLASQVTTQLATLSRDIDTVYLTAEYYTPTRTRFSYNEAFSFPQCRHHKERK